MTMTVRHRWVVAALSLGLALGTAACTDDSEPGAAASPSPTVPPPLETTATLGRVEGRLAPAWEPRVVDGVAAVVDGWIDAAYVGGDYPREDFSDAFPGFTAGAAAEATEDDRLMSNADLGPRIDGVTARARRVRVDVLAVHGRPAGATARLRLVFDTSGDAEKRVTVTGRLRLTRTDAGWQVFAYDVAKGKM
jgi:hypothetical protein